MMFCGCCDEEASKNGMFADYAWNQDKEEDDEEEDNEEEQNGQHRRLGSQDLETQINLHSSYRSKKREKVYASPIDLNEAFESPNFPKTSDERDFLDEALGDNFIFASLSTQERQKLIDAMQHESVGEGTVIIQEGDTKSDWFYVIQDGQVDFVSHDIHVGSAHRGGSFGELALLYNSPRAATCLAATPCDLFKVDQYTFRHLLARHAQEEEVQVCQVLESIPLFESFSPSCRSRLADALTTVKFKEGERIVNKGDVGEVFYIIQSGTVKVHDIGMGDSHFVDRILTKGDFFGERALLTGELRAANVTAVGGEVTTLCLSRAHFEKVIGFLEAMIEREMKKNFIKGIPLFAGSKFAELEMDDIADAMKEMCYKKGKKVCKIGEPSPQDLWIVRSGRILVLNKDGGIHNLLTGDYFGDTYIKAEPGKLSKDDAIMEEDTTCWVLSRKDLEDVIGDVDRLSDTYMPFMRSPSHRSIKLKNVEKHRMLGQGAFGKVWLVRNKKDNEPFAMKVMEKKMLVKTKQVESVMREKTIMNSLNHPFLLHMASSFQDEYQLYLLLQLIPGGELYSILTSTAGGIPPDEARFYAACVLEAFGYMHVRNICYRDLKPENILIDEQGYAVVVDFGFAKIVVDKTYTLCGTPEYLAPEIIMSKGHGKAVDWWSYGVLVYELIVGLTPFYARGIKQNELFKRIVLAKYEMSPILSDEEEDLIRKLLVRKQSARLGNLSRGHRDIKDHDFFNEIDFKKLVRKEIDAPWIPEIKDPFDASHFDSYEGSEHQDTSNRRPLSREEQDLFRDF